MSSSASSRNTVIPSSTSSFISTITSISVPLPTPSKLMITTSIARTSSGTSTTRSSTSSPTPKSTRCAGIILNFGNKPSCLKRSAAVWIIISMIVVFLIFAYRIYGCLRRGRERLSSSRATDGIRSRWHKIRDKGKNTYNYAYSKISPKGSNSRLMQEHGLDTSGQPRDRHHPGWYDVSPQQQSQQGSDMRNADWTALQRPPAYGHDYQQTHVYYVA